MQRADVALALPTLEEAGPGQLAPTTSTAMMMALGDALAMAAMQLRGWSRSAFGTLHPDGAIGMRLGRVTTMMHVGSRMPLVRFDTAVREVIVTMTACGFGIAGVLDHAGDLVGVITDGDLRRHAETLFASTAGDVMTCRPVTVTATSLAETALALMNRHNITALFVTQEESAVPVGLVHIHDFLRPGVS
jgi:arabinose-5-phosphate isomerase